MHSSRLRGAKPNARWRRFQTCTPSSSCHHPLGCLRRLGSLPLQRGSRAAQSCRLSQCSGIRLLRCPQRQAGAHCRRHGGALRGSLQRTQAVRWLQFRSHGLPCQMEQKGTVLVGPLLEAKPGDSRSRPYVTRRPCLPNSTRLRESGRTRRLCKLVPGSATPGSGPRLPQAAGRGLQQARAHACPHRHSPKAQNAGEWKKRR